MRDVAFMSIAPKQDRSKTKTVFMAKRPRRLMMTLYLKTTTDKYELPLVVEESPKLLAERLGLKRGSVATLCSKGICGYHRIQIEEDETDAGDKT